MIEFTEKAGRLNFSVSVVPRASRSVIAGEHNGALRVRIAAPPVEGAANAELTKVLARAFGVPRSAVEIVSGHASRLKRVSISGGDVEKLKSLSN